MLNPLVSCLVWAFEMLIHYIFLSRIAQRRMSVAKALLVGLILFEFCSGVNLVFHNNVALNTVCVSLARILFALLCFDAKPLSATLFSIILGAIDFALELMVIFGISALLHINAFAYNSSLPLLVVELTTSKSLFFLLCLILSSLFQTDGRGIRFPVSLFFMPLSVHLCLWIFWYVCTQDSATALIQTLLGVASVLLFCSMVLLYIVYQRQIESERDHIRIKSEYDRLQTEKAYYDILDQQNQQLMIYAHDAKNHLAAIQALNENPVIDGYLSKMSDQLKTYSKNCHSGNMMLDVMMNKYVLESQRRGVAFRYDVKEGNLSQLADMDLVAVLGNLMDNALRSAAASQARAVTLETTRRNGYSILIITNSCDTPPTARLGRLVTSKADRNLHGFGLKSVLNTLTRYQGDYSWEYDEGRRLFTTTVMIGE